MKKMMLATMAVITMVSTANAEIDFKASASGENTHINKAMVIGGIVGGAAIGGAIFNTTTASVIGAVTGGVAIKATQPKFRDKTVKITKIIWKGDK